MRILGRAEDIETDILEGKRRENGIEGDLWFDRCAVSAREVALQQKQTDGDSRGEEFPGGERQDMQKRAKLRCMHLLERKDYTEKELRRKLELGRTPYTQEEIDGAIAYVKGYHYIDDARYAAHYIESAGSRKSRRQMEQDLLRRGVDRDTVARAIEAADEIPEDAQIAEWIRKRHFDPATADQAERRRMYAFLARRGFEAESISRALRV